MRLIFGLLILFLVSCGQKQITFDVEYNLSETDFSIIGKSIIINDIPLYFQSKVENNYSKKSLLKEIYLIEICADMPLQIKTIDVLTNNQWNKIAFHTFQTNGNNLSCSPLIDCKEDFRPIFQQDKLSLRLTFKNEITPKSLTLKFRFTGKQEKTNVQYRIVA
jgi:hypothetical protein